MRRVINEVGLLEFEKANNLDLVIEKKRDIYKIYFEGYRLLSSYGKYFKEVFIFELKIDNEKTALEKFTIYISGLYLVKIEDY